MIRTRLEKTPVGPLELFVDKKTLRALAFGAARMKGAWKDGDSEPARKLRAYFAGNVRALDDIEVLPAGTPFQQRVWAVLRTIPAGETRSYAEVARAIGQPTAVRAVARANATNPIALVIPCHRVIGSDGKLTGYGGGLPNKKWLLAHERGHLPLSLDGGDAPR
jgi:methylated-DNA-[protein]-cysteine S-methyltransferase